MLVVEAFKSCWFVVFFCFVLFLTSISVKPGIDTNLVHLIEFYLFIFFDCRHVLVWVGSRALWVSHSFPSQLASGRHFVALAP